MGIPGWAQQGRRRPPATASGDPRPSRWFLVAGVLAALVHAVGVPLVGALAFSLLAVGAPLATAGAVRLYRPRARRAWWLLVVSGVLFTLGGLVRSAVGATGDLSAHRSLLPDAFALPGYAMFVASLLALLRARRGGEHDRGAVLDGVMLAVGSLVLAWVLLLDPVMARKDAALVAKLAIVVYPPISVFLVSIAARLAFSPGAHSPSYRLLLNGMITLLVGDVTYVLVEAHLVSLPVRVLDFPYAVSYSLFCAAALHPSMRDLGAPVPRRPRVLPATRVALVAIALLVPSSLLLGWTATDWVNRLVVGVLALVLTGAAIARLLESLRQQAASEVRLAHQATHDDLTGLPNRVLVYRHIERLLARPGTTVSVVFLDLDQFKLVNDSLGHAAGDRLLVAVADRLRAVVPSGHLIARLSGDEFVVVAAGLGADEARSLGERVRLGFVEPLHLGMDHFVSVSVGVAVADQHYRPGDVTELLGDADTAMYCSKQAGRDVVTVFDVEMRRRVARRVQVERDLRHALAHHRLEVHYQPIVVLATGEVEGVEALVRWPDSGEALSPSEFIPVAEESGLIVPLGAWVLEQACADLARCRTAYPERDLTLAVNLSAHQLRHTDVPALVAGVLERTGLAPSALWLEITESVMMEDTLETVVALGGLRELGVRLAADDFGTGFSSLSYLKRFPVQQVKIDRSFVAGLGDQRSDDSVVGAILAIATALELVAVAEGIETDAQLRLLVEMGCHSGQGHYFSPAVPADQLPGVLSQLSRRASAGRPVPVDERRRLPSRAWARSPYP